ncbi:MAG: hypothetical protein A3B68_06650 [Candidatus Melainabacteria bacterium RIFCSPHIGHO2_02_FULL_34_12]|nr:MAG: hypothetical protein A3B68_06650 [Candidatus Melainabacteria bacterium RIFCSPHIGHO2_02_FULL_34_12]
MNKDFKAVLFDLVGTLIYVKNSVGAIYSNVASSYGIKTDIKKLDYAFKSVIHQESQPTGGEEAEKKWWKKIVNKTFGLAGYDLKEKSEEVFEAIFKEFTGKNAWGIYPDAIQTLKKCCETSLKLGLISNFDSRLEVILKELDLYKYFNCLSYSGKVRYSKPDPRIFQFALKELNILPEEALYIGDSLDIDYYPALDLNINAILINRNHECLDKNVKRVTSLNEIFVIV